MGLTHNALWGGLWPLGSGHKLVPTGMASVSQRWKKGVFGSVGLVRSCFGSDSLDLGELQGGTCHSFFWVLKIVGSGGCERY